MDEESLDDESQSLEFEEQSPDDGQENNPVHPPVFVTQILFWQIPVAQSVLEVQACPAIALHTLLIQVNPTSQGQERPCVPRAIVQTPFLQICPNAHSVFAAQTPP